MKLRFVKEQGVIKWLGDPLEGVLRFMANGTYTLEIKKEVKKRSTDQNALMWMWLSCIEEETGTPKKDIYDYYCKKFLTRIAIINGREESVTGSSSKLNKSEMKKFLNRIQSDAAAEFGIRLPSPDDEYFNVFTNRYERIRY
ncbi:MAG: hypothetical protein LIP01_15340 [Tannerellaceae bacterium]|nr:hypothetical protein [Tannerellaceae bacterium]